MKPESKDETGKKQTNTFFWSMLILGGFLIIAMIGAFWLSNSKKERNNMGIVSPQDTAIVNKSDTLKR